MLVILTNGSIDGSEEYTTLSWSSKSFSSVIHDK